MSIIAKLKKLHAEGLTTNQIASKMNRSGSHIRNMFSKHDMVANHDPKGNDVYLNRTDWPVRVKNIDEQMRMGLSFLGGSYKANMVPSFVPYYNAIEACNLSQ